MISSPPSSLRPPLKWVGGKRWFIDRYKEDLRIFVDRRIVEPFCGSLALTFGVGSTKALVGDLNPHLINFYKQLQKPGFSIEMVPRTQQVYYALRSEFNDRIMTNQSNSLRSAQLFWLLNRMGFNGLCRFNQKGLFNTPFGEYTSAIQMPSWPAYQALLASWSFHAVSYEKLPISDTDFIFCDPPYDNSWQGYYETNFTIEQQKKVAQWLKKHKGPAVIMNHATPGILEIYRDAGFECHIVSAPRSVSAKASSRKNVQEVIATHHFSWKDPYRSV